MIKKIILFLIIVLMVVTICTVNTPTSNVRAVGDIGSFIGEINIVPYTFAPRGYAFCEGQLLPIAQNTALFSIIGTKYGGDGRTTFALPDLRGAEPQPGVRYVIALVGVFPSRD